MQHKQYYPRVECWPPTKPSRALNATACQILLDGMFTTTSSHVFLQMYPLHSNSRLVRSPSVVFKAPELFTRLTISTASGDCSITLLMDGSPVPLTWHDIWGAAVKDPLGSAGKASSSQRVTGKTSRYPCTILLSK